MLFRSGLADTVDDPGEYNKIEQLRKDLGLYEPTTKLKRFMDAMSGTITVTVPEDDLSAPKLAGPSLTSKEIKRELNAEVRTKGKNALILCGYHGGHPQYGEALTWFYDKVAALSYWARDATTPERAQERVDAAEKVLDSVRERGLWW